MISKFIRTLCLFILVLSDSFIHGQILHHPLRKIETKDLKGGKLELKAPEGEEQFYIFDKDAPEMKNCVIEFDACPLNSESKFGVLVRYNGKDDWTYVGCDLTSDILCYSHWFVVTPQGKQQIAKDIAKFYKGFKRHVRIECFDQNVLVYIDREKIAHCTVPLMGNMPGQIGLRVHDGANVEISNIRYAELYPAKEYAVKPSGLKLHSEQLEVVFCKDFPVVSNYRFKPVGTTIKGARTTKRAFRINGQLYPANTTAGKKGDKIIYSSYLPDIDIHITTEYSVNRNKLYMEITSIEERGDFKVYTIGLPGHDLVTMNNDEHNAQLSVADNIHKDDFYRLNEKKVDSTAMYGSIAILNNNKYAVTLDNNSIYNGKQLCYRTKIDNKGQLYTSLYSNEWIYRGITGEILPLPHQTIIFAGDENNDGYINWQDGAVALVREYPKPYGTDKLQNSYTTIAMNFASGAQYPFLRILDNIKKFYLATDGFGQMVEIKGYQSEGHDSGHPDYAGNYNTRAGGLRDLKLLTEKAAAYNALIGVHINHSESYPEAKSYDDEIITDIKGWAWLDQAYLINKEKDVLRGTFEQRVNALKKDLPALGFVYLDTYREHRFLAYKTANLFNDNGWPIWTEDSDVFFREGVWIHHPGKTNSLISRFVQHQFRDGHSSHPLLLGGYSRSAEVGFMGWQKGRDFNNVIRNFFTAQLPYRFLMHHPLLKIDSVKASFDGEVTSFLKDGKNHISMQGNDIKRGNIVFIPWKTNETEKIYHYNPEGGITLWTLPASWEGIKKVKLYLLDDSGRHFQHDLVVDESNQVSIDALPEQGYVIYREEAPQQSPIAWGEGGPVVNPGFDGQLTGWNKSCGMPLIEKTQYGQSLLQIADKGGVTQSINLPAGEYTVSVWYQMNGKGEAKLSFGNESYTVYDSSVRNFTDNTDRYNTSFQRIKLPVTHTGGDTSLELSFIACNDTSYVQFDDVRIVAQKKRQVTDDFYFEDFEDVDEGWGPFVAAKPSSYTTHLSEIHIGYTDDTIDGRYSLKTWREGNGEVYRTIPSILRIKPKQEYSIQFDYKVTQDDAYRVVVRSQKDACDILDEALNGEGTFTGRFVTGDTDDYYIVMTKNTEGILVIDNFMLRSK